MNTELAKRFLLAAADGYKWWPSPHNSEQQILAKSQEDANSVNVGFNANHLLPDYFRDLNACHGLLQTMTKYQCNDFNRLLIELRSDIPMKNDGSSPQSLRWTWGQPAEVMAECFGRVLNLW